MVRLYETVWFSLDNNALRNERDFCDTHEWEKFHETLKTPLIAFSSAFNDLYQKINSVPINWFRWIKNQEFHEATVCSYQLQNCNLKWSEWAIIQMAELENTVYAFFLVIAIPTQFLIHFSLSIKRVFMCCSLNRSGKKFSAIRLWLTNMDNGHLVFLCLIFTTFWGRKAHRFTSWFPFIRHKQMQSIPHTNHHAKSYSISLISK